MEENNADILEKTADTAEETVVETKKGLDPNLVKLLATVFGLIVPVILIVVLFAVSTPENWPDWLDNLVFLLFIPPIVVGTMLAKACKSCKTWYAMKRINKEEISTQVVVKSKTHKSGIKIPVAYNKTTYLLTYACKNCGHTTQKTKSKTVKA